MISNLFYFSMPAPDLEQSKAFYAAVLGWTVDGGSLGGHITNVTPSGGLSPNSAPTERTVYLTVEDVARSTARVVELGGEVLGDISESPIGSMVACRDNQGTHFCLQQPNSEFAEHATNPQKAAKHGDLFYFSLPVTNGDKGRKFYSSLLGWKFGQPGPQGGSHVENMITDGGIGAGRDEDRPEFWFRVDDIGAAIEAVRQSGGEASAPEVTPQGPVASCSDNQGVAFGLVEV